MSLESDFKFEKFEEYFGDIGQVRKIINDCGQCGSKLVLTHLSDYKNLIILTLFDFVYFYHLIASESIQ